MDKLADDDDDDHYSPSLFTKSVSSCVATLSHGDQTRFLYLYECF